MRAHTHARNTHWICARVCSYTQSCTRIHVHAMFMCAHIQYTYVWTRTCTLSAWNMQAYTHTRIYCVRTHTHAERTGYVCKCIHERTHAHTGNAYLHARNTYTGYVHASTHAGTYTRVRTHSQATHNANTHAYPIQARSTLCFFWFDFDPLPFQRYERYGVFWDQKKLRIATKLCAENFPTSENYDLQVHILTSLIYTSVDFWPNFNMM